MVGDEIISYNKFTMPRKDCAADFTFFLQNSVGQTFIYTFGRFCRMMTHAYILR